MKCLVPVKQVVDYTVKIRVKKDKTGVETQNVKMSMNPFDEIALEEAVLQKEKGIITEIIAVSVGITSAQETLRMALARGADKAILVETDLNLEPLNIAKILQEIVQEENPTLIIMGKQAIDDDCNQTGQMLAGLLQWSQGTFVSRMQIFTEENTVAVVREVDGGLETLKLKLPSVITTDLRLNEPRYISLPNVMKAKSKPLIVKSLAECKLDLNPHLEIIQVEAPHKERKGLKISTAKELVEQLRRDKIIE